MLSMENLNTACRDFMANSALNTLPEFAQMKIFQSPLIGVASAKDPLFLQLKKAVGVKLISGVRGIAQSNKKAYPVD